jgi:small subunit ribosomal protein S5
LKDATMAEREQRGRGRRRDEREETPEFADRLVAINRVSKTVKGGKRFGFAALVVVGDQRGRVGFGKGKAKEVPEASARPPNRPSASLIRVPLKEGRTLHHDVEGPSRRGQGRDAHRTGRHRDHRRRSDARRVRDAGHQGRGAKSTGTQNPYNMIRATMDGLKQEAKPASGRARRGKKVADILPKRDEALPSPARSRGGLRSMAKTIVVKQIGSPIRRPGPAPR